MMVEKRDGRFTVALRNVALRLLHPSSCSCTSTVSHKTPVPGATVKLPPQQQKTPKMAIVNGEETKAVEKILAIVNELALGVVFTGNDFELSKFKSGFVSEIYRVTFTKVKAPVPASIVVKFFNLDTKKEESGYEIVDSQLNCLLVGQAGLGPRILLIKPDAIVMELFAGEQLTGQDDDDPAIREDIARKLARFHALSVPIARNDHLEKIRQISTVWMSQELTDSVTSGPLKPFLERLGLPHLLANKLRPEVVLVEQAIIASEPTATLVFSHVDFNHLNLIVSEDPITGKRAVKFIDFDFSSYFFRGADLGRYFVDCKQPEQFHPNDLVPDEEICQFLAWYREECSLIYGPEYLEKAKNSVDALLKEAKLFALYAFIIDIVFCIYMALEIVKSKDEEKDEAKLIEFLKHADKRYGGYLKVKARFLKDGSFP